MDLCLALHSLYDRHLDYHDYMLRCRVRPQAYRPLHLVLYCSRLFIAIKRQNTTRYGTTGDEFGSETNLDLLFPLYLGKEGDMDPFIRYELDFLCMVGDAAS